MHLPEAYTVTFLTDRDPITRLVLLKRAASKKFAPNRLTGIGGKVEAGESLLAAAHRELTEETGLRHVRLVEFARCVINGHRLLSYSHGRLTDDRLPACNEGSLHWTAVESLQGLDILANTKLILAQWHERQFRLDQPWTTFLERAGDIVDGPIKKIEVVSGLADAPKQS